MFFNGDNTIKSCVWKVERRKRNAHISPSAELFLPSLVTIPLQNSNRDVKTAKPLESTHLTNVYRVFAIYLSLW